MRKVVSGLAVAAALVGVLTWLRAADPRSVDAAPVPAHKTSAPPGSHSPDVVLSITPGTGPAITPPGAPKRSALMQEVLIAVSWRAVYDRLSANPSRTGEEEYVLARILEMCGLYAKMPPLRGFKQKSLEERREEFLQGLLPADPERQKRIAAYDRAWSRGRACDGLEHLKATREEFRAAMERAAALGDPKAQAAIVEQDVFAPLTTWSERREGPPAMPRISEAQIAALRRAAETGDPSAIETAGRVFASTIDNLVVRAGPDGRAVDPRAFHDAWVLAACEFGLDCGAEHRTVLHGCAHRGNCGASTLREHMFYYEHSPRQSQLINDYHSNLVNAIRARDWSWFTFHHGARPTGGQFMFGHAGP